jgi:hypothetical protein
MEIRNSSYRELKIDRERRAGVPFLIANHTREPDPRKLRRKAKVASMVIE